MLWARIRGPISRISVSGIGRGQPGSGEWVRFNFQRALFIERLSSLEIGICVSRPRLLPRSKISCALSRTGSKVELPTLELFVLLSCGEADLGSDHTLRLVAQLQQREGLRSCANSSCR